MVSNLPTVGPETTSAFKPFVLQGDVLESYAPRPRDPEDGRATVTITDANRFGRLYARYPELLPDEATAYRILREGLYYSLPTAATDDSKQLLEHYMWETAEKAGILRVVERSSHKLSYYLMRDTFGFEDLDALLQDDDIEEISCTGFRVQVRVKHRRYTQYGFMETNLAFENETSLQSYVMKLAQKFGDSITRAKPYFEATILLGNVSVRAAATLGSEMSLPGSSFAIRRQKEKPITVPQMTAAERGRSFSIAYPNSVPESHPDRYEEDQFHKTLTSLMAAYFWILLESTSNILIAGQTSSGKTTMLNAILSLANPMCKVVSCEDNPEILLPPSIHWERLRTRTAKGFTAGSEKYEINLFDLLVRSLRFSPDYLVVGEVRGREAQTLGQAMMAGHSCLSTIHAGSSEQCIQRLLTAPMNLSLGEIQQVTCVVTMKKETLPDGSEVRRVESVDDIVPDRVVPEGYRILNVFKYVPEQDSFKPSTPEQVLGNSPRLREKAILLGWSNEELLRELTRRASYLLRATKSREFSVEEFIDHVRRYRSGMSHKAQAPSAPASPLANSTSNGA